MKITHLVTSVIALAVLSACAAPPKRLEALEQARAQVQTLEQDPQAAQVASQELQGARAALKEADQALQERESPERVLHLAYVAERRATLGQTRLAEARTREQIASAEAERNRVLVEARSQEVDAAKQEVELAKQDVLTARAELERMQQQFSQLQAKQTERGMVLTLGDVLFDTAQATLKPGADLVLNRLAEFLNTNPNTKILIEGHTDSSGSDAYNQELSQRRAYAVADALRIRGVPSERYQPTGRGEAYPVASNDNAAGRQQNRRVEIVFSDQQGRFGQAAMPR